MTESQSSNPTESDQDTSITLSEVGEIVQLHYGENIWQAVKAGIAVTTSLSMKRRDHCLPLVYEGPSGKGKSVVIRMLMPDRVSTKKYLCRIDDFTPASFVSHAANRKSSQLAKIDLLPRIKDKVMLTKELAPLFRDNDKDMRQNFARLTSVLDGNGYLTSSGVHGTRGYEGRYVFNWLGATTPIPDHTYKVMAQLGNRLLQYEISGEECSEEELMDFARNYGAIDAVKECQKAVNDFIEAHFQKYPVNSFDPDDMDIEGDQLRLLVRCARLIAQGRIEIEKNDGGSIEPGTAEGPQRVILLLQTLVQGLALAEDRAYVTTDDMGWIRYIAFSSIPRKRRDLLYALLDAGGTLDSADGETALGLTRPTAITRMRELGAIGIALFTPGNERTSTAAEITLAEEWKWLLTGTP